MVGYYPTEIDLIAEEIESLLSNWAIEAGIRQEEIITLSNQISDIITNHLINGRGD